MKPLLYTITLASIFSTTVACATTERIAVEVPVVSVDPVVRTVTEKIPHKSCWDEQVRIEQRHGHRNKAPTVVGAILGGVAGGAIGRNNRNQPLLAGAGAALGAAIAHDASQKRHTSYRYVTQERCEVDYELRDKEQITGYRVGYRYGDSIYYTRTTHRPGPTMKLNVSIEPAHY
ncbi:MAG: glycine zipper 2TM domain-containing protein [Halioglobus sp.]